MDFTTDVVFAGVVAAVAMVLTEIFKVIMLRVAPAFVWPQLNGVTVANLAGALIVGPLYFVLWPQLHAGAAAPVDLYAFILGGWLAGWTAAGMRSSMKDVKDGSLVATTHEDVAEMRFKNSSKNGIGG